MELKDTVDLMLSKDYKDRFKAEYYQLENRYNGLSKMIVNWDNNELSFTPTCPRATYDLQLMAIKNYLSILEIRAKIEGIEL